MDEVELALQKKENPSVFDPKEKREEKWKKVLTVILTIIFIFFILLGSAFLFVDYYYLTIYVDGSSMYPTLKEREFGLVDEHQKALNNIKRGNIIVFKHYTSETTFSYYIKRVIGLPGESIDFVEGDYSFDEVKIKEAGSSEFFTLDEPYLTNEARLKTAPSDLSTYPRDLSDVEYFVMGDNRHYSNDSRRDEVGLIRKEDVVGVLVLIQGYVDETRAEYVNGTYKVTYKGKHYYLPWNMRRY